MRALFQGESAYPSPGCRKAIQSMQPLCRRAEGQQTLRSLDDCCQLKCLPQVIAVILLEVYCITVRNIYSNFHEPRKFVCQRASTFNFKPFTRAHVRIKSYRITHRTRPSYFWMNQLIASSFVTLCFKPILEFLIFRRATLYPGLISTTKKSMPKIPDNPKRDGRYL